MNFLGKNILVVGGSSGIGLSLVKLLCELKANVYVVSRTPSEEWAEDIHYLMADVLQNMEEVEAFLGKRNFQWGKNFPTIHFEGLSGWYVADKGDYIIKNHIEPEWFFG